LFVVCKGLWRFGVFEAVVTDIRLESRSGLEAVWWMSLDTTRFGVGDRGVLEAVTRSGTKLAIPVTGVVEDADGIIWHVVEKPLAAGTEVRGTVTGAQVLGGVEVGGRG
jgi:alanyl-tRNA synthetase